jgi:chromosome segregation ATPase
MEPVVIEPSASSTARQSPPTPRLLIDQASVLGNLDALRGYRQQLQQGIADNPRLQQAVAGRPDAAKLADEVRRLGYDGDLTTLSGIEQATAALQQRAELTLKEIQGVTDAVKRLGDEIQAKADQVVQTLQRQTEQHDQVVDRESLEAQLERMEIAAELRDAILSAEAELAEALRRFGAPQIDAAQLETLTSQLAEPQRAELEQALDAWKTQLEGEFASIEPPKPLRQSLAAMRREYL